MSIARALQIYGEERGPETAAPQLIGFHIDALVPFWGNKPVSSIKGETCRAYVSFRSTVKPATAKRELQTLGAAVNYCEREGYLSHAPRITTPKTGKKRTRWLTRKEAAALLHAAHSQAHLATFIRIGLYTGTRSAAALGLAWSPNTHSGWVDIDRGLLFRKAEEKASTNKLQPTCPIPVKLTRHLAHVRRRTNLHVIEFDGLPVKSIKRSWRSACARAGLGPDVTPHVLRHTCVTWLLQAGVAMWEVAGYVGMSEQMVRDRYGHQHPDFLKAARDAL